MILNIPKMIRILKPTKELMEWALELVVTNMKIYNKTPLLKHVKSKSIYNPQNVFVFSFGEDKRPNGFLTLRIFSDILYVYEIHVESRAQGQGIGTDLLNFIKDKYNEVSCFVLYVHKTNPRAIEFYKANKFEINKKAKCDFKYHEMIFTKQISPNGREEKDKKDHGENKLQLRSGQRGRYGM